MGINVSRDVENISAITKKDAVVQAMVEHASPTIQEVLNEQDEIHHV